MHFLCAADVDSDGDIDIVSAALIGDIISWFENEDGQGTFGLEQIVSDQALTPTSLAVADLDGDTDLDILSSDSQRDQISWYRNLNDATRRRGDFDQDGVVDVQDVDLLCAEILADGLDHDFDLTDDGAVNRSDMNELIVNILQTSFGDTNLDGVFDSSDFVSVFAMGEYEDGIDGNSTWADGDWNCDGDFTTSDLVFALQAGGYVSAAVPQTDVSPSRGATLTNER